MVRVEIEDLAELKGDNVREIAIEEPKNVAKDEFDALLEDAGDSTTYKNSVGFGLAIGGAGFVAAAGLAVSGAWTGVGVIVGAFALGRSAVSIGQQLVNAASAAETIQKRIESNGKRLTKQLESDAIKTHTAAQIAETAINNLLAVEIEKVRLTVHSLHDDFDLMTNTVKGMKVDALSLVGNIDDMLAKQLRAAKELEPLKKLIEQTLNLSGASKLMERVEAADDWSRKNLEILTELKGKYHANATKVEKIATELIAAAGSFVAGSRSDPREPS